MGEDREKIASEETEEVEAHKLIAERQDLGKLEPGGEPEEDVEGHALFDARQIDAKKIDH